MPVSSSAPPDVEPSRDCPLCPRLVGYRNELRSNEPGWHNAPVPTLLPAKGASFVRLLVVGLAPGVRGANRTGRPFTGDYAGDLLYSTLFKVGLANDRFRADTGDGLELFETAVTNAVRCVPPQNKPLGEETNTCRRYLAASIEHFPKLVTIVTLGRIAHDSTVRALGGRLKDAPFAHAAENRIGDLRVVFELSLLSLQHEHRPSDRKDVPRSLRGRRQKPLRAKSVSRANEVTGRRTLSGALQA